MINQLSILIPTYNNVCLDLVRALQEQAAALPQLEFELLVADDGSTMASTVEANRAINALPHCRYIERKENTGRSVIRNFLAQQAQYDWLLFVDSNMSVITTHYLSTYQHQSAQADVVYGGYQVKRGDVKNQSNLRYIYECAARQNGDHNLRQLHPYSDFRTSNFLIRRSLILEHPLDERFYHYGYEDLLFGKTLQQLHVQIAHIDNPLGYEHFIDNAAFVDKTEESLRTLYEFRQELEGTSKVIAYAQKLERLHLKGFFKATFPLYQKGLRRALVNKRPCVFLFNVYKLMYYLRLEN